MRTPKAAPIEGHEGAVADKLPPEQPRPRKSTSSAEQKKKDWVEGSAARGRKTLPAMPITTGKKTK